MPRKIGARASMTSTGRRASFNEAAASMPRKISSVIIPEVRSPACFNEAAASMPRKIKLHVSFTRHT